MIYAIGFLIFSFGVSCLVGNFIHIGMNRN